MAGPYDRAYENHIIHGPGDTGSPVSEIPIKPTKAVQIPPPTNQSQLKDASKQPTKTSFGLTWD